MDLHCLTLERLTIATNERSTLILDANEAAPSSACSITGARP